KERRRRRGGRGGGGRGARGRRGGLVGRRRAALGRVALGLRQPAGLGRGGRRRRRAGRRGGGGRGGRALIVGAAVPLVMAHRDAAAGRRASAVARTVTRDARTRDEDTIRRSMRLLVTGGAGYVGSICAQALVARGDDVTVLDSLVRGHREAVPDGAAFVRADLL